jgi:hypothetical protein
MAVNLSPVGGVAAQFFTNTGAVLTGGKIYTYAAGTTTPAVTYTSSNGLTAQPNPIVLDAAGRVPNSGEIWLTDGINYKFVLKDSTDVLIATYDNISGINSNFISFTNSQQIVTATAGQTVFNLSISYQPGTNSLSVFVDGVNQYGPGAQYAYTETSSTSVTFTNGLHVGAVVKFTTTQQQGAGAVNASQVTYNPAGTGAVATNVQAKLRQYVSVKDFGAVGDGTTNDTAAIQAAIDACLASGSALYVPSGSYKLTSQVNVALYTGVPGRGLIIYGEGWGSRFIIDHTGNGFSVTCSPSFGFYQSVFQDLYFTDGSASPSRIIYNNGAINTLVRDCIFHNATVTTGCVVNDNAYGLTLQGCIFTNIVGTGAFYAQVASLSTYSFVNSIIDCDFSTVTNGVTMQGCNAFLVSNTTFQECTIGFFANPQVNQTTAFNITFDTCWFERNTTYDIQLDSDANYWCEASIRNTQFAGFDPTYQAHIQLAQKSKVTIEGTPSGNQVIVSGTNDAAAVLIRATNFQQSGTFAWTSIDPYGNISAATYKSLSGVYANATSGSTVTLVALPSLTSGAWLVAVELDGTGNATANSCVGVLTSQTSTAVYTPLKTATGLTVSVSGLNLQGNQTSGAPYSIKWSLTRLS